MTFDSVTFVPVALSTIVLCSVELLQDSVNIDQALRQSIAGAMPGEIDRVSLIGTGSTNQPKGISNIAGVGSVSLGTNGAAPANYDCLVDAITPMLTANAPLPTAYIMPPRTYAEFAKLKDSQNRPLTRPELIANIPLVSNSRLPINETQGTSNLSSRIITGDFTQAMLGVRLGVTVKPLVERYAEYGQVGFWVFWRGDFQVMHPASFSQVIGVL